jgi:hypothetical protein
MNSSDLRILYFTNIFQFWADEKENKFFQIFFLFKIFFSQFYEILKNIITMLVKKIGENRIRRFVVWSDEVILRHFWLFSAFIFRKSKIVLQWVSVGYFYVVITRNYTLITGGDDWWWTTIMTMEIQPFFSTMSSQS